MNPNLFIRFKGIDHDNDSAVDLAELGESLTGFDSLLKSFGEILRISDTLEIKATATEEGSIIVDLLVSLQSQTNGVIPFDSIDDFLNFLKLTGSPAWHHAVEFFNSIEGAHKTLNEYAEKNPADFWVTTLLIVEAFKRLLAKARKNKEKPDYNDKELPKRIAEELHKLIKHHGFKKALKPIVEDKAQSIELSTDRSFKESAKVDQENFQDLLAEDEQVLPDLENGTTHTLKGDVTSLKGTRGDSLTFHIRHGKETVNLDVLPPEGATSKAYRQFYQESVEIVGTIIRDSLYKKPKVRIQQITLNQGELTFPTTDGTGSFVLGKKYTRREISAVLGGSEVEYLPSSNGQVVCGCFTMEHNPEAPDIIIPGTGKVIEREAEQFCAQSNPIPVFIKRHVNGWEYVGDYKAVKHTTDAAEIAAHHKGSVTPPSDITRVIYLQRVPPVEKANRENSIKAKQNKQAEGSVEE